MMNKFRMIHSIKLASISYAFSIVLNCILTKVYSLYIIKCEIKLNILRTKGEDVCKLSCSVIVDSF